MYGQAHTYDILKPGGKVTSDNLRNENIEQKCHTILGNYPVSFSIVEAKKCPLNLNI